VEPFEIEDIIEFQTNKIYLIISNDKKTSELLIDELKIKISDEISSYKISLLAESPDKIK